MNGDGYTDLSGGLLYYISDGETPVPGGPTRSARRTRRAPGRAARVDRRLRPGHRGPRHADRVERRRPGRDQRQGADASTTCPGRHAARRRARRRAGRQARAVRRHLLRLRLLDPARLLAGHRGRRRRHVELLRRLRRRQRRVRRRQPGGRHHPRRHARRRRCSRPATAPRASARRRAAAPSTGIKVGASTQFGGTGWDSIAETSQVVDNDVIGVVEPRPGRHRRTTASTSSPTAPTRAGDATLNTVVDGRDAWDDVGRHEPLDAGRRRARRRSSTRPTSRRTAARPGGLLHDGEGHPEVVRATTSATTASRQGAGSVDAGRGGAGRARQRGPTVSPDEWRVGDYRGTEYPVFTHVIAPGGTDTQTFNLNGGRHVAGRPTASCAGPTPRRFNFTTSSAAQESAYELQRAGLPDRPHQPGQGSTRTPT